ncbi:MAG: anti-sigma factor [Actinomycetota bacterium]
MIDHDEIDELLAGYVLRSLTGPDAVEADRLLTDHVPGCPDCLSTLDAFQGLTGDLATMPAPVSVPDTLLPSLHRSLDGRRTRRPSSWNPGRLVAAAAAAIVLVGVAGLAITQVGGDGGTQLLTQADLQVVNGVKNRADAEVTPVGPADEVTAPGLEEIYLEGSGVAMPPTGSTYRLWVVSVSGTATYVGDFAPRYGQVALAISIDPSGVDHLLVTLEPAGSEPSEPGEPAWPTAS